MADLPKTVRKRLVEVFGMSLGVSTQSAHE